MNWRIPEKTFLVGEYLATQGGPAIVLTTEPCFEIELTEHPGLDGIHPDSPSGRFWLDGQTYEQGLSFSDPLQGLGGMGASSAQFLGAYLAHSYLSDQHNHLDEMLRVYQPLAYGGHGIVPSGYDVIAQALNRVVYIHRELDKIECMDWPFDELSFILIHTKQKLATHEHLKSMIQSARLSMLFDIVMKAKKAFEHKNADGLIAAVQDYGAALKAHGWLSPHTDSMMTRLLSDPKVLAAKGCGSMGADMVLLLVPRADCEAMIATLTEQAYLVIASTVDLYQGSAHFEMNFNKY
jgi:mevalonate kinase